MCSIYGTCRSRHCLSHHNKVLRADVTPKTFVLNVLKFFEMGVIDNIVFLGDLGLLPPGFETSNTKAGVKAGGAPLQLSGETALVPIDSHPGGRMVDVTGFRRMLQDSSTNFNHVVSHPPQHSRCMLTDYVFAGVTKCFTVNGFCSLKSFFILLYCLFVLFVFKATRGRNEHPSPPSPRRVSTRACIAHPH